MNSFKRQYHIKILASALLIVLSLSMLVMVTFAWYVMSTAPEVSGMQIKIGSDTIRVAPDCKDESGQHYPGAFQGVLETDATAIPENFWGLIPVSTADGKHWFSATYESLEDGGDQIDDKYLEDTTLSSANLTARPKSGGNYLYLDFWVVAPKDYDLRVSTATQGSGQSGSYVKVFPQVKMDDAGNYSLDETQRQAESSLRIGFLVNEDRVSGDSYKNSTNYDSAYKILKGEYQKPGEALPTSQTSFTIYEPNCDWHADTESNGHYNQTLPLAWKDGKVKPVTLESVQTKLAAQTSATWTRTDDGTQTKLDQALQTAMLEAKATERSITNGQSAGEYLLKQHLKGQLSGYITSGQFIEKTGTLKDETDINTIKQSGATTDAVIVSLKKNVPQRIRMFVWLEGQDIDCTNEAALKTLLLNLELAGETKQ